MIANIKVQNASMITANEYFVIFFILFYFVKTGKVLFYISFFVRTELRSPFRGNNTRLLCSYMLKKKGAPAVKVTCSSSWCRRVDRMRAEGGSGGVARRPGAGFAGATVGGGGNGVQRAGRIAGADAPGGAGDCVAAVLAAAAAAGGTHLGQSFAAPATGVHHGLQAFARSAWHVMQE